MFEHARAMFNGFLSGAWWLLSLPLRFTSFFSSPSHQYPDNEAGLLMRRHMAHQSWFDSLSHSWFKKSFFSKTLIFLGATLAAAWLGVLAGAATLFALTAAGLLIAAGRVLLSSHEEHRMAGAVLAAEESRRLTVELGLCKDQLSKSLVDAQAATEKLDQHSDAVFIHSARVDAQVISIEQQKEPLSIAIATVSKETSLLVEQEQLVRTKIEGMSADLSACSATIIKATDEVSEAYTELMAVIEVTRQSQAANQNRFFAAGGSLTNTLTSTSYFEQVDAENDETEAFLKSIGAWRPMTTI